MNQHITAQDWHNLEAKEVMQLLESRLEGLTDLDASKRLQTYGPNRLRKIKQRSWIIRFLIQFHNVLIYVLLAAALLTTFLAHWVDTAVILGVVFINAFIGYIQEGKAEQALKMIRAMLSHKALVRRDGHSFLLPAEELVPGDIVHLQSGDKVPADVRLIRIKDLQIDESLLTGESVPVEKIILPVPQDIPVGDRICLAFSGTLVTYGQGSGVVVGTGDATEIGRISALLGHVQTLTTPLLRQINHFARWLTVSIIALSIATFVYGVLIHGYSTNEMFLAAVGLAVAAIPEGLPAIMTITLAIGVMRMAKRNAIIRRLPAVETLGSVTVICSDKTGTLTRNEMTVQALVTTTGLFYVSGTGYDPHGSFSVAGKEIHTHEYPILHELTRAAMLCNDAELRLTNNTWTLHGDPTEGALMTLGYKAGLDIEFLKQEWPRLDIIPFESIHRFMATLHHDHSGHRFIYIKGAPERILEMCNYQRHRGENLPIDYDYWNNQMINLAQHGLRLLAVAFKPGSPSQQDLRFTDVESGLTLLGIIGIIDPPREEAIHAVKQCRSAGIRVKMITGDHAVTAMAIAVQMDIGDGKNVLTGQELDLIDDETLRRCIQNIDVFARASPEHKLRLVKALQANGEIVVMTGDGVNDAPSLKRADVGIAMGKKGTEVAKESSEAVLVDDNFASITHAIEEGRTVYDNLRKAILFILPTNGGEAVTLILAIFFGMALPITPVQILWVNMVTAITLALTLAFEPSEVDVMKRRPRDPKEPILSGFLIWRIVSVSLILVAGTFGLFLWERLNGSSLEQARTVAVNTLVFFEIFYLFNSRYILASSISLKGLLGNKYTWLAVATLASLQFAFTYAIPMQNLFGTTYLTADVWGKILIVSSSVFLLVEIEKAIFRHVKKFNPVKRAITA